MRVVVTGASGQLGAAVVEDFRTAHDTVPLTRRDADLTDDAAVAAAIDRVGPEVIVNCAAYNDVDGAEDHPIEALNANAFAVRALARAAERLGATLVHYSTDFVFDGTAVRPYSEADRPNPRSVYAASKLLGEWFAADAPRAYVLRVESLFGHAPGGPPPKGSIATIVNALRTGREARVFEDRTVSPTYVADAARATLALLADSLSYVPPPVSSPNRSRGPNVVTNVKLRPRCTVVSSNENGKPGGAPRRYGRSGANAFTRRWMCSADRS